MVIDEEDIKNSDSPMLRNIRAKQEDELSKEGTNRIVNENIVNKGKKDK
jgi:hypothetical protein